MEDNLSENEKKMMSEEEQAAFGKMVKKGERHIGGVMVIGYAGLILAHLIKGTFYRLIHVFEMLFYTNLRT